jgi:hypothetical protein
MASPTDQRLSQGDTPTLTGPWSFRYFMEPVGKHDDNFHLIDGPEGDQGSSILEGSFVFPGTHSEALKYARLIASAPELYEADDDAADFLIANYGSVADPNNRDGWSCPDAYAVYQKLVAATSKARGEA